MRTPSYIVKNHNGIYYFRYVIPQQYLHLFPNNSRELRRSLKTRDKSEAINRAKIYWVKLMEKLTNDFEQDAYDWERRLRRGSELIAQLEAFDNNYSKTLDITHREEFISHLSDDDAKCIELASEYRKASSKKFESTFTQEHKNESAHCIRKTFDAYLNDKGNIEPKTSEAYFRHFELFQRITKINFTSELNLVTVRTYKEIIPKLPPRMNQDKKLVGKNIDEILAMNLPAKLAFKTRKENLATISSFLKWLHVQMYVSTDFSALLRNIKNPNAKKDSEYRAAFDVSDLNKIFSVEEFQVDGFKKYSYRYWLPILALYTGARANELCQLLIEDVYQVDGVLVFDINDHQGKKVKTKNAVRKVPIHKEILKLGFDEYLETVTNSGELKLFPALKPDRHKDSARKVSRFFNETYKSYDGFIDYAGVKKQTPHGKKVFHSFRHTFINQWKQQRLDLSILKQIVGHASSDITLDTYGKAYLIQDVHRELNKLDLGLEMMPRTWHRSYY